LELLGEVDAAGPDEVFLAALVAPEFFTGFTCLVLFSRSRHSWLGAGEVSLDVCFACVSLDMGIV
jgi:succinate dehydrogenase hydrophobic anchor subunit